MSNNKTMPTIMSSSQLKTRIIFVVFIVLFITALFQVFSFHSARQQQSEYFLAVEKNIHQLSKISEEIDRDIFAMLSFQLNNFDSLAIKTLALKQAQNHLKNLSKMVVAQQLIKGLETTIQLYLSESIVKLQLLEQLKSKFSSYSVTLHYIPIEIEHLKQMLPVDSKVGIDYLYALLLKYRLFSEQQVKQQVLQQINNLKGLMSGNESAGLMENLFIYIHDYLVLHNDINVLFKHYNKVPTKRYIEGIKARLEEHMDHQLQRSFSANTLFLVSIAFLLSALFYSLYYFYLGRKKAIASRDLFHDAIESLDESFAIYDNQDKLLIWNSKFEQLYPKLKNTLKRGVSFVEIVEQAIKTKQLVDKNLNESELHKLVLLSHKEALKNIMISFSNGRQYIVNHSKTHSGGLSSVYIDVTAQQKMQANLLELSRVVEQSPASVIITDTLGNITYVNPKFEQQTGYSKNEILGENPRILKSGETSIEEYQKMWGVIHAGRIWYGTFRNKKKSGELFWERVTMSAIHNDQDKITAYFAIKEDITRDKANEEQLRMAATVFKTSSEAIFVTDAKNCIKLVNPSFEKITGYCAQEVLGKTPAFLSSDKQDKAFYQYMWKSLEKFDNWQGEIWNKRKNGEIYPQWLSIAVVKNEQQQVIEYVAIFSDISARKKAEEKIHWQANFDQLTRLPNRSLFLDRLRQFIHTYQRDNKIFALLFMDLNRFKIVNDTLGHDAGDLLLKMVASRLSDNLSEADTIARFGGDEFTILLPRINKAEDAAHVAQRLIAILTEPFDINGSDVFIGISIGITLFPNDAESESALIRNADMAMYDAKESGKNSFHFFTKTMNKKMLLRMRLEKDLRYAIVNNEFFLEYQPVISAQDEKVIGAEALVRWMHPEYGRLAPDKFIGIAEETGMIKQLGEWVLKTALAELSRWHQLGHSQLTMAVNVSSAQRLLGLTAEKIQIWLDDEKIDSNFLTLEITESLMMSQSDESLKWLQLLKKIGVILSIDDFGTGYSSLSYLHRFPVDILKIDKSFIDEMLTVKKSAKLVESIISLAHHFGLSVVAEGVEEKLQLDFLQQMGCDNIQGYYYSKPVVGENLCSLVKSKQLS